MEKYKEVCFLAIMKINKCLNIEVDEFIIKALTYKYMNNHDKSYIDFVKNHQGFILIDYFDERFDEFQGYNVTLEDFIKKLINEHKS